MMPYWSLGWHQCRYGYKTLEEVRNVVESYANHSIPMDSMWIDIEYASLFDI